MSTISNSIPDNQQPAKRVRKAPSHWNDYETNPKARKTTVREKNQSMLEVFASQKLRYVADAQVSPVRREKVSKLMTPSCQSQTDTPEGQRFIQCIQTMKDDGSDVYAQAVEIRDVVFKTPEGAAVLEKGLFAKREIKKGEVIGVYGGKLMPLKDLKGDDRFDYLFEFPETPFHKWCIDGREMGNYTRYMNHCNPKNENVSSVEFFYGDRPRVIFVASKTIPAGTQLMYDYGPEYWKNKGITPSEL